MKMKDLIKISVDTRINKIQDKMDDTIYNKVWDNFNKSNLIKPKKFLFNSRLVAVFSILLIMILTVPVIFILSGKVNIFVPNKEVTVPNKEVTVPNSNGIMVPAYITFNEQLYVGTDETFKDTSKIIRQMGIGKSGPSHYDIYEIKGVNLNQKIAVNFNSYFRIYKLTAFSENDAIELVLAPEFSNLPFPKEAGKLNYEIKSENSQNQKTINVELESNAIKTGDLSYTVNIIERWSSSDYNKNNEDAPVLQHRWQFNVTAGSYNLINDKGSPVPQLSYIR